MDGSKVFISSCSRREWARRRPTRGGMLRLQLPMVLLIVGLAVGAFIVGRGGL